MSGPVKLTKPQSELLRELTKGHQLIADILCGYPNLGGPRSLWIKQQTVAACVHRGWIERGERVTEHGLYPRFRFDITAAGRRALSEGERS